LASTVTSFKDYGVEKRRSQICHYADLNDKVVLDVGCGNGIYTLTIATYAKQVVGIDINKKALYQALTNQVGCNTLKVHFVLMSAEALGFLKDYFDVVVCIETLEHIQKQQDALRRVHTLLKDGGKLVLYVPNKFYPFETHGIRISNFAINHPLIPLFSFAPNFIRRRFERARIYTSKEITTLLINSVFMINALDYMLPPLDRLKNNVLKKTFRKVFSLLERTKLKVFAMSILVVATKF